MDDLGFREFRFLLEIGTGSVEALISPSIDGIREDAWNSQPREWREEWLNRASREWAMEYIEVSWE